jgi:phage tail protein X
MATYKVKSGDTLMDVCYNTTGSLRAINDIMNANGFDTYTPQLEAGRIIEVPDVVYNSEAVSVADARPFNSASLPFDNLNKQMEQLEFMLGDVGSIIYTFDGSKIAGKYLSLNANNNNEGYVNWGDGTPVEYIKNNAPFGHNYAAGTSGEIVVTFLGRTGAFFLSAQSFDQETFKQSLIKVDITNADAACPSGMWRNAFWGCNYLVEVVGSFAGKPNIKNANSMFINTWRLNTIPPQMFRGCPNLEDVTSAFGYSYNIPNADYMFADCPKLTEATLVFSYVLFPSAVSAFENCTSLKSVVNLFAGCRLLTDVTNVFKGCTNIGLALRVFQNCAVLNPPVNVFDDCKKAYNFKECYNNLPAATNESPYTVVNGQKIHLWERTPELGFALPIQYDFCFTDSPNFADYANIPEAWGGPPKTENNVKLRCWPMMAQIVADPTTMTGVVYLNGEILGYNVVEKDTSNRLVIDLPLPTAITSVAGLYVVFYSEDDAIIGGSLALADNVAAPTEGAVYETYYNAGYGDNLPSIYPVFAPNNDLTPGIINAYFQSTYNVHIPSLGDFEVVGSESVSDAVEITLQITELGWSYYLSSGSDLWIDMQQKLETEHSIPLSALAEDGCTLTLSVAIEGYVMTAPAIEFNTMRGSIMPILDFTYVPPPITKRTITAVIYSRHIPNGKVASGTLRYIDSNGTYQELSFTNAAGLDPIRVPITEATVAKFTLSLKNVITSTGGECSSVGYVIAAGTTDIDRAFYPDPI